MSKLTESPTVDLEANSQPFLYEIRVKGRLSQDKWSAWFDNLTITAEKSETVMRGMVQDHAALYGLLGRLRDLAVPLLSVNVLDAEAQRTLRAQSKRYNLISSMLLVLVYLFIMGGLITLAVFIADAIPQGMAVAMLFAALGALAYVFYLWSGARIWQFVSYMLWPAAALTFLISLAVSQTVNPYLTNAMIFFLAAGGLIYLLYYIRQRGDKVDGLLGDLDSLSQESMNDPDEASVESLKDQGK